MESSIMKQAKRFSAFFGIVLMAGILGCAATSKKEGTAEYVDDSAITTKVKSAMVGSSGLKSTDIGVETFKGVVQLSGFVDSQAQMSQAVKVAQGVGGVKSVKNDMRLK
jgi:osmotically-inducible protein OsmY